MLENVNDADIQPRCKSRRRLRSSPIWEEFCAILCIFPLSLFWFYFSCL